MIKLENWMEVTKGLYRYVVADSCYEIHIMYHAKDTNILTANASLYIVGDWTSSNNSKFFERELLLNGPLSSCLQKAVEDKMNKNYDELSIEEKEALIDICKEDPVIFFETVLKLKLLESQKVYIREIFKSLNKQNNLDFGQQYFGEPYKCKMCNGTGMVPIGPGIRGIKQCPECNRRRNRNDRSN